MKTALDNNIINKLNETETTKKECTRSEIVSKKNLFIFLITQDIYSLRLSDPCPSELRNAARSKLVFKDTTLSVISKFEKF